MDQPLNIDNTFIPIGNYNNSKKNAYYNQNKKSTASMNNSLKTGEIIRGKIIEVYEDNIALVQLPTGTFKCEIAGQLQESDILFFRVHSLDPTLVLRIHSVAVRSNNKESQTREILRILDLPNTILASKLVEYLKSIENIIKREEFFGIYKVLGELDRNELKLFSLNEIFSALDFMQKNSFPPDLKIYNYLKYYFLENTKILKLLNEQIRFTKTKRKITDILLKTKSDNNILMLFIKYIVNKDESIKAFFNEQDEDESEAFNILSAYIITPLIKIKSKSKLVKLIHFQKDNFSIIEFSDTDSEYLYFQETINKITNLSELINKFYTLNFFINENPNPDFRPQNQISIVV
jgi:hypothetical protein